MLGAVDELWGMSATEASENRISLWHQIKLGGDLEKLNLACSQLLKPNQDGRCRYSATK
jgi:hypothetical protein